jgi:hypothetical protein
LKSAKLYYSTVKNYIRMKKDAQRSLTLKPEQVKMAKLADLGFSKNTTVETILSTYSTDGQPNAAPIGIITKNEQRIVIKLYNSSQTYRNLLQNKCAVINITSDTDIFYRTTFKEATPTGKLAAEWFEKAETVNAPKLRSAQATVEIQLAKTKPINREKTEASCDVKLVRAAKTFPKAHSRATCLTIEAIIHATRVKAYLNGSEKQRHQALKLMETIESYRNLVNRVAPDSSHAEIMADLAKKTSSWRTKG